MSLNSFLKQNVKIVEEVDYVASERILDEEGKPVVWRLRPLDTKEVSRIRSACMVDLRDSKTGQKMGEEFDADKFWGDMIMASLVHPKEDFENKDVQDSWGVFDALSVIKAMLQPGEYDNLCSEVNRICGFESMKFDELVRDARKN